MLPVVSLRDVSRDDVDRIGWWLEDEAVSSKWFGHYACGDPVHRGYEPRHMLEASEGEWGTAFNDSTRLIYSIYAEDGDHIGESQILLDGKGSAELSLLIGRKDRWHHGYGTSAVILLLEKIFKDLRLQRAWVSVPTDNSPATGLFEKFGFRLEATRDICKRPDGTSFTTNIMAADASRYAVPSRKEPEARVSPVITVTGLSGSGSDVVATGVARKMGGRLVYDEIADLLRRRLGCSEGEIDWLETRYRSFWHRLLSSMMVPMDWSSAYDAGYHHLMLNPNVDYDLFGEHITKKQYLDGLAGVVKTLAAEGDVVLHGHASHLFVPAGEVSLNVFVSASPEFRAERMTALRGSDLVETAKWLEKEDGGQRNTFRNLFDTDILDMGAYDLSVNLDRVSFDTAAQIIVGAVRELVAAGPEAAVKPVRETVATS